MTGKIFINYRRGDEPGFTQALLGRLEHTFPAEQLFIDVDNIPPGEDFARMLESQVAECDAMLAIIGNGWLDATDERGNRRLHDPNDFVRIEIESALRQGKRVIPVLVHEARMPRADELPEAIRPLATRNAVRLTHERFRADVQGLIRALQGALEDAAKRRPRLSKPSQWALGIFAGVCAAVAVVFGSIVGLNHLMQTPPTKSAPPASPQFTMAPPASPQVTTTPPATPKLTTAPPPMSPQPATTPPASPQLTTAPPKPVQPAHSAQASTPHSVPAQPAPAKVQAAAPIQAAAPKAVPPNGGPAATSISPDALNVEVTFWNSIKDQKNASLFEDYLKRYPSGVFADIARVALEELSTPRPSAPAQQPDDSLPIADPLLLDELRDRLYELNFDPGPRDGPMTDAAHEAIREFQQQSSLEVTGAATMGLLRKLREIGALKPWGAIVYGKSSGKWGMAWGEETRKAAVARARLSCGDSASCPVEISFFGVECGVFAYSSSSWAITAREDIAKAKAAALSDCAKRGRSCEVVASVCADGRERFSAK